MFICLFFILLSGCQKEQDINLLYNKWEFEYFTKKGLHISGKEYLPDELKKMTVEFFENENVTFYGKMNISINSTINIAGGNFKASKKGYLEISILFITEVGGTTEQLQWEKRYFNALGSAEEFKIKDKNLKIYYNNDDETDVMVFKK